MKTLRYGRAIDYKKFYQNVCFSILAPEVVFLFKSMIMSILNSIIMFLLIFLIFNAQKIQVQFNCRFRGEEGL